MPAAITHYLLAERVMEEIKKKDLQQNLDGDAFFWGAQGPDFLFFHRALPWWKGESLREYGSRIHRAKPSETISILKEYMVCLLYTSCPNGMAYFQIKGMGILRIPEIKKLPLAVLFTMMEVSELCSR